MLSYEEIQRLLEQNRQELGKREADIPNIYKEYSPSTDPEIAAARAAQADKVKQLFDHDSQLAQVKFQPQAAPGATVTGAPAETPPEMILDPLIGLKAANTQTMETANEAIDIGQNIAKRKDVLAESLDKALKLFQIGLEIKKAERESLKDEFSSLLSLDELNLKKNAAGKATAGKEALTELFNKLTGLKQKVNVDAVPTSYKQGITPNKGEKGLEDIKKELVRQRAVHPNVQVDYSQNKDGRFTYNYFEPKENQVYLTPEEFKLRTNPQDFLGQLSAGFEANYPDQAEEGKSVIKQLFPEYGMTPAEISENKVLTTEEQLKDDINGAIKEFAVKDPKNIELWNLVLNTLVQNYRNDYSEPEIRMKLESYWPNPDPNAIKKKENKPKNQPTSSKPSKPLIPEEEKEIYSFLGRS